MGLEKTNVFLPIVGINSVGSKAQRLEPTTIASRFGKFEVIVDLHLLPSIANVTPSCFVDMKSIVVPDDVRHQLADPKFNVLGPIDILLGADVFYTLLSGKRIPVNNYITFHDTCFGWVLTGKVIESKFSKTQTNLMALGRRVNTALSLLTSKSSVRKAEEVSAEDQFARTHYRDETGRFVVSLPFVREPASLGDSLFMAQRCFLNIEKRCAKDPSLALAYHEFMAEYLFLKHTELVTEDDTQCLTYYLPHHRVLRAESLTSKLRVVFDGSAPARSELSLNDILLRGPTVQPDLLSIILRFRLHKIVLTADIAKIY